MSRLPILLLGPDSDPTKVSIQFATYSHDAALEKLNNVSPVIGTPGEKNEGSDKLDFRSIEAVLMPTLQQSPTGFKSCK
ncbi:MAG: hypothetical protein U1F09_05780 [Steroidobacteraceae bacterium]